MPGGLARLFLWWGYWRRLVRPVVSRSDGSSVEGAAGSGWFAYRSAWRQTAVVDVIGGRRPAGGERAVISPAARWTDAAGTAGQRRRGHDGPSIEEPEAPGSSSTGNASVAKQFRRRELCAGAVRALQAHIATGEQLPPVQHLRGRREQPRGIDESPPLGAKPDRTARSRGASRTGPLAAGQRRSPQVWRCRLRQ